MPLIINSRAWLHSKSSGAHGILTVTSDITQYLASENLFSSRQEDPRSAIQNINNQQVQFVETATNTYAKRPVKLGAEVNGQYTVLEGLTVGEPIVTDGSFLLRAEWLKTKPAVQSH